MTGAELLEQVQQALDSHANSHRDRPSGGACGACRETLAALDGCVLLTREEALRRDEQNRLMRKALEQIASAESQFSSTRNLRREAREALDRLEADAD